MLCSSQQLCCTSTTKAVAKVCNISVQMSPRPVIRALTAGTAGIADTAATSVTAPERVTQGTPLHAANLQTSYDAIVIGSGLGGLTAAVGLAKFGGKRVLVLEQHYTAGGFTHAFRRGKFAWNVGVHYVGGGIGERGGELFAPFNAFTDGKVDWVKLPDVHDRLVIGGKQYDCMTGREAWLDKMTSYFPDERQALERFLDLGSAANSAAMRAASARSLPGWLQPLVVPFAAKPWADLASKTLAEVLDDITQNKELQAVLAGSWPDVGMTPGRCSAGYYLLAYDSYIQGAYIPAGGANSIAAAMIPAVEAAGGAVVTSADVQEVLVRGGKAVGVRLADGREIMANLVISNAGLQNTYNHLLPQDVAANNPKIQEQLQQAAAAGNSPSIAILFVGLNEPLVPEFQGLGTLRIYNSGDYDGEWDRFVADPKGPLPGAEICCCDAREHVMRANPAAASQHEDVPAASHSSAGVTTPSERNGSSTGDGSGVSTLQVMVFADYDWFKEWAGTEWHRRGDGYATFKQHLEDRLMQKLAEAFPDLPGRIAYKELSTPLSTEHFSKWPQGAIYGIGATPERFRLTKGCSWGPATPIPGLLLTGQDVVGDGVLSAFLSGTMVARMAGGLSVGLGMLKEIKKWS